MSEKTNEINCLIADNEQSEVYLFDRVAERLTKETISNKIQSYCDSGVYQIKSKEILATDELKALQEKLNLSALGFYIEPKYALIIQNTNLRIFPTQKSCTLKNGDLDYFAIKWLKIGERVIAWHYDKSKTWCFIQCENAWGWVKEERLGYISEKDWFEYERMPFGQICAPKITVNSPKGRQCLYFATRLWLDKIYAHYYALMLPERGLEKKICFKKILIAKNADVCVGYRELSSDNILTMGMKFLGEKYDWGGKHGRHDCTSLISDLYRACGIILPSNSTKQLLLPQIKKVSEDLTVEERREILRKTPPGSILLFSGHGMLYLGEREEKMEILHSVYRLKNAQIKQTVLGDLNQIRENDKSLLESIEGIWDVWDLAL